MKYIIRQLKNKLRMVFIPMSARNSVSASVWIKAGGRYEKPQHLGISHFLEHLVFRGTIKRTAQEIKQAIEGIGGMINAFTSSEFTCFFTKIPKKYLSQAVDVLSDITLNPLMRPVDIEKEKKIIAEEIKMYKDMPSYHVHDLLHQVMWPNHPLGKPLAGTYKSVNGISQKMFKGFKDKFYQADNMALIIAGSFDINKAACEIREKFAGFKTKKGIDFNKFFSKQKRYKVNFLDKDTEQAHLCLGFHSPGRTHPDRYASALFDVILGGNMSSRLFEKIREEHGLAYQISTSFKKYQDTGAFVISAGIKNNNLLKAVDLILKELKRIKGEYVKESELQKAKDFIIGQLLMELEDTTDCMLWAGERIISLDKAMDIRDILIKIRAVSLEDIKRIAGDILKNENLNLALIGPLKSKIKDLRKVISNFN